MSELKAFEYKEFNFKERAQEALKKLAPNLKGLGTQSLYAAMCASTFLPVYLAMQGGVAPGNDSAAAMAVINTLAGIGANLLAARVQKREEAIEEEVLKARLIDFLNTWKDEASAQKAIAALAPDDPLRSVFDAALLEVDAMRVVQNKMTYQDREWFRETIREELKKLGNLDRFEAVINVTNSTVHDIIGVQHIVNNYYARGGTEIDNQRLHTQITNYLKWVQEHYGCIELRGIERAGGAPVVVLPLENAYVPLEATVVMQPTDEGLKGNASKVLRRLKGDDTPTDMPRSETFDVGLKDILGMGSRLAIIGGPGCGKTTVLAHMAWALATSLLDPQNDAATVRLGLSGELPLPILVTLASFNRHRRNLPAGAAAQERSLAKYVSTHLIESNSGIALPEDFFTRLLEEGQSVMLLLDGLDEVANEDDRNSVRQAVETLVDGKEQLRTIVTCRTVAYKSTPLGAKFKDITVKPLDFEQHVTPMVRKAHECIHPNDPDAAKKRSDNLLSEIVKLEASRHAVMGRAAERLVDSPLMVRLLIIVDYNERKLPDERAKLFDKAVNALIRVDFHLDVEVGQILAGEWETRRDMLQHLAFHMHLKGQDQGREIEMPQLKKLLSAKPEFVPQLKELVEHIQNRGGLLEERDGVCRFIHLAFQEFLAARYLREEKGGEGLDAIIAFLEDGKLTDSWWREPILLLVGYMGANAGGNARTFLGKLSNAGKTPDEKLTAAELAGVGALEWRESGDALQRDLAVRITALYEEGGLMAAAAPLPRARAGQTLARLGDLRDYALHVDAMRFCLVPRGHFYMGSPKEDILRDQDESPPMPNYLVEDFAIGRYPVTQAQFQEFVADHGYSESKWWTSAKEAECWENNEVIRRVLTVDGERSDTTSTKFRYIEKIERDRAPRNYGEPFSLCNHPVVGITWYEAIAFCEWLTVRWRELRQLKDTQCVRLPNEPEWEKAARGGDLIPNGPPVLFDMQHQPNHNAALAHFRAANPSPRLYPYSDQEDANKANIDSTNIGSTSPIGCFSNGESVYGCHDMSGNVWEWTRSAYGQWQLDGGEYKVKLQYGYPYTTDDGRERHEEDVHMARVLRGGAFYGNRKLARCAIRGWFDPLYCPNHIGFRVVVSPF